MTTMKAVRIHNYGGPEVLVYEDVPRPAPKRGEVLIRVHAAGVNPVDWKIRSGRLQGRVDHHLPLILGWDVAGVIETLGEGVTTLQVGDAVYARPDIARDGAYAEYLVARADELALKPKTIDFVHAAAVPLSALVAWQSLFDAANLSPGQSVLIHAGAGGVGHYAVQLAHWKGAHVITTTSARNADFVRSLGADEVIDYTVTRFDDVLKDIDVVFDTVGGDVYERSWKVLQKRGVIVSILNQPSAELSEQYGARAAYVFVQPNAEQLTEIAKLIDKGNLRPIVQTVLPLAQARQAHELIEGGHTRGKIVLKVTDYT
ncbi:MAG TPA: NADP-dependent oxidoreductase [Gammaproteobacteria bacterium]|nr:NADP-dependent oxidoreductase [Gammaproteobacteria bacterium]